MSAEWLYAITVCSLCALIAIICCVYICYHLLHSNQHQSLSHLHKPVRYLSISSSICFSLAIITASISLLDSRTLQPMFDIPMHLNMLKATLIANLTFWSLGVLFMYLLFISRLRKAYQQSVFKLPDTILVTLYLLVILLFLFNMMDVVLISLYYYNSSIAFLHMTGNAYSEWSMRLVVSTEILHLLTASFLLYLFISRLLRLVTMMESNINDRRTTSTNYGSMEVEMDSEEQLPWSTFSTHQFGILNVITKQSVLSASAILSSQIYFMSLAVMAVSFNDSTSMHFRIVIKMVNDTLFALDCVINCVCILLTFSSQTKLYFVVCAKCDQCLRLMCMKYVRYELSKRKRKRKRKRAEKKVISANNLLLEDALELSTSRSHRS